jgi:tetratricopeptide (TPR) repeat protein
MRVRHGTRVIGIGVACALLVLAGAGAGGPSLHDARSEALRLYEAGRFAEALPLFDQVLEQKPHDIELLNKRACISLRMNQPRRAIADLDRATNESAFLAQDVVGFDRQFAPDVATTPGPARYLGVQLYPSAFTNRGIARMMLGEDDAALADFQHAIDLRRTYRESSFSPNYAKWRIGMAASYCGLGQVGLHRGDLAAALDACNEAIAYNPDDPNGFVGRGRAMAGMGRSQDALSDFNEALRLDPNHARALGYRAATLTDLGRALEAVDDLDRSIQLDPNAGPSRRLRAAYLARLGRHDEALRALDEAHRLDPHDAGALKDRGAISSLMGDPARALPDLDAAIALDPNNTRAYQNRAGTYNALGRHAEAVRDADTAIRLEPQNAGAWNNRGLARLALGALEPAVADLSEAIRINPGLAAAHLNRGGALVLLGRHDEEAADYALAVRLDPRLAQAYTSPAAIPAVLHLRPRPARDDLAVRQEPAASPARAFCDRGNVRRAAGDWAGAIAEFSGALEADPRCTEALALRGWSKLCAGEPGASADARAWFLQAGAGWRDPLAPSVALLGILAARRDGRDDVASGFLDEALANVRPTDWPAPVFRYLKRQASDATLLASADLPEKVTLARAVLGFDLLVRGYRDAALEPLRWVRDHGLDRSIARDLAVETLRGAEMVPR